MYTKRIHIKYIVGLQTKVAHIFHFLKQMTISWIRGKAVGLYRRSEPVRMRSFDTDGTDVSGDFDTDRNRHIYIKKYQIPI